MPNIKQRIIDRFRWISQRKTKAGKPVLEIEVDVPRRRGQTKPTEVTVTIVPERRFRGGGGVIGG